MNNSLELSNQIKLLRMRVAAAAAALKKADDQADEARHRRKIAKLLAKRARKCAKDRKAALAKLSAALAEAEASLIARTKGRSSRPKAVTVPVTAPTKALTRKRSTATGRLRKNSLTRINLLKA